MSVNATTMRTRLSAHGIAVPEGQPKALVAAYGDLVKSLGGKYAKPEAEATPAKATPAKAKRSSDDATPHNCGCGCGHPTITSKATFLPGHDARFAGQVGRGEVTPSDFQQALLDASPALAAKVEKIRANATAKQAVKDAREVAKVAYAKALADALATA